MCMCMWMSMYMSVYRYACVRSSRKQRVERENTANCFRLFCWPRAGHSRSSEIGKRVPKKQMSVPKNGSFFGSRNWGTTKCNKRVGLHFVVPRFLEPNRCQKREPFFKKNIFFLHVFFFKKVFFPKRIVVYAMILPIPF